MTPCFLEFDLDYFFFSEPTVFFFCRSFYKEVFEQLYFFSDQKFHVDFTIYPLVLSLLFEIKPLDEPVSYQSSLFLPPENFRKALKGYGEHWLEID